jgi:hypothetical protein
LELIFFSLVYFLPLFKASKPKVVDTILTLKGRSPALLVSILVHIFIFVLLNRMDNHAPKKSPPPKKAIKSYLYKKPPAPKENTTPEKIKETTIDVVEPAPMEKKEIEIVIASENTPTKEEENVHTIIPPLPEKDNNKSPTERMALPSFSALEQLSKLRNNINKQSVQKGFQQYQQHRSVSSMHGEPIPVQHSKTQPTDEEKKEAATTTFSDNVAIRKSDDGLCFVERDLSNVGMEGVKSVAAFACGSSKFDKSFRTHMKKIKAKLGK